MSKINYKAINTPVLLDIYFPWKKNECAAIVDLIKRIKQLNLVEIKYIFSKPQNIENIRVAE